MEQLLPEDLRENGGFPEPPPSGPVRIVAARHEVCETRTRVRLPEEIEARAVRRVRCARCEAAFEVADVEELGVESEAAPVRDTAPVPDAPRRRAARRVLAGLHPPNRVWRWVSVPLGAAAVIGALVLIQGSETDSLPAEDPLAAGTAAPDEAGAEAAAPASDEEGARVPGEAAAPADSRLVRGPGFSVVLGPQWRRERSPAGDATFAAAAVDGGADATLWVERAPELDLASFERRSLRQLRSLAGSVRVTDRVSAPTPEATIIRIAADVPEGQPRLEVTLRAAGPFRYYLATTVQPDASRAAIDGAELIHGSFTPDPRRGR